MNIPKGAKICSWCGHSGVMGDGGGVFHDTDEFAGYYYPAIPICGGCGGLGVQFDDPEFKALTSEIMKLRFEYCPTDGLPFPPEEVMIFKALSRLLEKVQEIKQKFGPEIDNCYASRLLNNEAYKIALEALQHNVQLYIASVEEDSKDPTRPVKAELKEALLTFYRGEPEKGIVLYEEVLAKHNEDSALYHDLGALIMNFVRSPKRALPFMIKSTKLKPKCALHFVQTALTLSYLDRKEEAMEYLRLARIQPDYDEYA